ncbi:MAG: hypothetical protein U0W65_14855 [Bacteroidia bacterium]
METVNSNLNSEAKAYFIQQGQSINKLNDILDSNILSHYIGKWFSYMIELSLYILFSVIVIAVIMIPLTQTITHEINSTTQVTMQIKNDEYIVFILIFKLVCVLLSLPILLFAILLGRNRKKSIH